MKYLFLARPICASTNRKQRSSTTNLYSNEPVYRPSRRQPRHPRLSHEDTHRASSVGNSRLHWHYHQDQAILHFDSWRRMPSLARPESSLSLRPASISQPNVPASVDLNNVPQELQLVLGLLSLQTQRPYCDGYVLRKHVNLPGIYPPASDISRLVISCSLCVLWAQVLMSRWKTGSRPRLVRILCSAEWNDFVTMECHGSRRSSLPRRPDRHASIHQHH